MSRKIKIEQNENRIKTTVWQKSAMKQVKGCWCVVWDKVEELDHSNLDELHNELADTYGDLRIIEPHDIETEMILDNMIDYDNLNRNPIPKRKSDHV